MGASATASTPPSPGAGEASLWLERGERAEAGSFQVFLKDVRGGAVQPTEGALYFRTGFPSPAFNGAIVIGSPSDLTPVLDGAIAFCRGKVPWSLSMRGETWAAVRGQLEPQGFHSIQSLPAMLLSSLDRPEPPVPAGLTIVRVRTATELGAFFATGARGFGFPGGVLRGLFRDKVLQGLVDDPHAEWYVGLLEGRPVATSMRGVFGELSYVAWVSVVPEHRKKGFGEAMTWRAVLSGRSGGARVGFLRASEMGNPVYRKMGFVEVGTYHVIAAPDRSVLRNIKTLFWFLGVSAWYATAGRRYRRWPRPP